MIGIVLASRGLIFAEVVEAVERERSLIILLLVSRLLGPMIMSQVG